LAKGINPLRIFNPTTPSGAITLNRLTLSFAGSQRHLEAPFAQDYFDNSLFHIRLCHWLTIFFYSIPGVLDAAIFPQVKSSLWAVRYLLVCPVFLLGFGFTYTAHYRRWWQIISLGYILLTGGGFIWMVVLATPPSSYGYYVGIIISMMFGYTLIRERFIFASFAGLSLLLAYVGVSLAATAIPLNLLFHNGLFIFTTNLQGMLIAYFLEFSARRDFYLRYVLNQEKEKSRDLNIRLEEKVVQRTQALSAANKALQQEIDDRLAIEAALREDRERLKILFDFAPDGYCVLNLKGEIIEGNRSAAAIAGCVRETLIGKNILDLGRLDSAARFQARAIRRAGVKGAAWGPGRFAIERLDGDPADVEIRAHPVVINRQRCLLVMIRDITDQSAQAALRARLEKQLAQAQKMEAVGTLAGGIAHDFNNILSAIIGYAELTRIEAAPDSTLYENLNQIHSAGQRARDLIRQILAFSRRDETEITSVQVSAVIKEALKFLRASIPTTIEIRSEIASEAHTRANAIQLQQIVMNLGTNAAHAMRNKGGILEVTLADVDVDATSADEAIDLPPGAYLCLTVSDNGCGMPPEVLQRLFDPYFTTKPEGEGSGLGMAVVHGIVSRYQGAVKVSSEEGKGTTVAVYLARQEERHAARDEKPLMLPSGTETVLVVDDESPLVTIEAKMLTRLGYRVTTCESSLQALEIIRRQPGAFAAVVTDMSMPKMNGAELARAILSIRPNMPIVLCTGYSAGLTREKALAWGVRDVLMKPIGMQALAVSIRQAIDAGRGADTRPKA
jgi:PAS domain S-box-containing protein